MNATRNKKWLTLLTGAAVSSTLMACPPEDPEQEQVEIETGEVRQNLTEIVSDSMDDVADGLDMLASFEMVNAFLPGVFDHGIDDDCNYVADPDGVEVEVCEPYETEPAIELSPEMRADIVDFLETKVFIDAHIEEQTPTQITYLLTPDALCEEDPEYPDGYQRCVDEVEIAQIRLVASSMAPGSVDIDVLLSEDRLHPLTLNFAPDRIDATVDLAQLRDTILFIEEHHEDGELIDLPETFEGRVSLRYDKSGDAMTFALDVDQAINVVGNDFDIQIAAKPQVAALTADTSSELLSAVIGFGALNLGFPIEIGGGEAYSFDEDGDPVEPIGIDTGEIVPLLLELAGLTADATLIDAESRIEVRNLGLGPDTARAHLDGEEVLAIDLNADAGRSVGADITMDLDGDSTDIAIDPLLDLQVLLAFHKVADLFNDLESFLYDDEVRLTLDGDAPAIEINSDYEPSGIKVTGGLLTLHSSAYDISTEIDAGQCLIDLDYQGEEEPHLFEVIGGGACTE